MAEETTVEIRKISVKQASIWRLLDVKASVVFGAMTKYDNMRQEQYKREQCKESEWKGNFLEKFPEIPTAFHSTKNSRLPFDGTIRAMKSPKKPKMHVN